MPALILAEIRNGSIAPAVLNTLTAATGLADEIHLLVASADCKEAAQAAGQLAGVDKVLVAEAPHYAHTLAENLAALLVELAKDYDYILAPADTCGKNVLPRAAALLDVALIADICGIESADTFVRPTYAGNALATVQSSDAIKLITVRATAFEAAATGGGKAEIATVEPPPEFSASRFHGEEFTRSERPELTAARVVVAGGRGLRSKEEFARLDGLADRLNAAIGASRAAVDAGFVPNDYQVGQTGKIVAPDLYIAVGISGAIQHLAGMIDSKVIVAINKDEEAPIFEVADYGIVGDLFKILPELEAALDKLEQ